MGGEAFGMGEGDGRGAELGERGFIQPQEAGALHEVEDRQAAGEAGAAAGGEDVVGAGDVIAEILTPQLS